MVGLALNTMLGDGVCVGAGVGVAAPGTVMPTQTVSPNLWFWRIAHVPEALIGAGRDRRNEIHLEVERLAGVDVPRHGDRLAAHLRGGHVAGG